MLKKIINLFFLCVCGGHSEFLLRAPGQAMFQQSILPLKAPAEGSTLQSWLQKQWVSKKKNYKSHYRNRRSNVYEGEGAALIFWTFLFVEWKWGTMRRKEGGGKLDKDIREEEEKEDEGRLEWKAGG